MSKVGGRIDAGEGGDLRSRPRAHYAECALHLRGLPMRGDEGAARLLVRHRHPVRGRGVSEPLAIGSRGTSLTGRCNAKDLHTKRHDHTRLSDRLFDARARGGGRRAGVQRRAALLARGSLLRTGPAKFEIGEQRMRHWFDGLAMMHRFTINGGRVSYGNRFLESRSYTAAREQGRMVYGEFATDPCRALFRRVQTLFSGGGVLPDNANVNIGQPRRALHRDDREPAASAVRPAHVAGGRRAPLQGSWAALDRTSPLRSCDRRVCSTTLPSWGPAAATASSLWPA